jgi:hypothetical protein
MTKYYKYKIRLNDAIFLDDAEYSEISVISTDEKQAFKEICNHEINYNPNWGYKLLKKERVV